MALCVGRCREKLQLLGLGLDGAAGAPRSSMKPFHARMERLTAMPRPSHVDIEHAALELVQEVERRLASEPFAHLRNICTGAESVQRGWKGVEH